MTDSKQIDDGGLAFPGTRAEQVGWASDHGIDTGIDRPTYGDVQYSRMSLRDYFAIHALGMGFDWVNVHETGGYADAARVAYEVADAMIAARKAGE